MTRDFHLPGRSAAMAGEAMAATSHPLATYAALEVLRAGGTAADAAVTAVATLCVVEPHMTGIGGDCFCLVAQPGKPVWGYNGSGRTGAGTTVESLQSQGVRSIGMDSVHAVTVPGALEAWEAVLKAHGRFDLSRALAPAIRYAEHGFPVAPKVAYDWAQHTTRLRADAGARRHFLINDEAPKAGDRMSFPALAETLKTIARQGARAFYEGPIADDIAQTLAARGGLLTPEDFNAHRGETADAIATNYGGLDVVELPPNGQGLAALVLLNIFESLRLGELAPDSVDRLHLAVEASRLAYGLRDTHIADPANMRVDVSSLLDKRFAATLGRRLDRAKRVPLPDAYLPGSDTVYLTVVDRDRTAVSFINSLYGGFGVGIATERSGVMLQNRGACFVVKPGHPNCVGPKKRPMHTIIPALGMRNGRCDLSFGVMGGSYQAMGHAWFISNLIDHGMDVQEAIDHPRLFFEGEQTVVERGVSAEAIAGLKARGHDVALRPMPLGGGQAIAIDWERGVLTGGSDPRKDGCALGY